MVSNGQHRGWTDGSVDHEPGVAAIPAEQVIIVAGDIVTDVSGQAVGGSTRASAARLVDRGVRFVLGTVVDLGGVTRAKGFPVERFPVFVAQGMGASPWWVVFCADFGIAFIPEFGVTGDLRLRIDPARTTIVEPGVAWAPAELFTQDGQRFAGCPRGRLKDVVARLGAAGLTARTGAELEFMLTERDGAPRIRGHWQGYGARSVLDVARLLTELTQGFADAGMPIEQLHAEYGADQFEIPSHQPIR